MSNSLYHLSVSAINRESGLSFLKNYLKRARAGNDVFLKLKKHIDNQQDFSLDEISYLKSNYHLAPVRLALFKAMSRCYVGDQDTLSLLISEINDEQLSALYFNKRFGWQLALNSIMSKADVRFIRSQIHHRRVQSVLIDIINNRYPGALQLQWFHIMRDLPLCVQSAFATKRFERMLVDKVYKMCYLEKQLFSNALTDGLFGQSAQEMVHNKLHFVDNNFELDFNLDKLAWVECFGTSGDKLKYRLFCLENLFNLNDADLNKQFIRFYLVEHKFNQSFTDSQFLMNYASLIQEHFDIDLNVCEDARKERECKPIEIKNKGLDCSVESQYLLSQTIVDGTNSILDRVKSLL